MGILGFLFAAARLLFPGEAFVVVPTAADHPWPGQHVNAAHGSVDLTDAGDLAVEVSNRLDRVLHVTLSVKSRALQGRSPGGGVALAPRAAGVIRCDLRPEPWRLDAPLKFAGMNGYPIAPGIGSNLFDLREVTSLPMSSLEKAESLEQLRWLQNGYRIRVGVTDVETVGIDTPADLQRAEEFLKETR